MRTTLITLLSVLLFGTPAMAQTCLWQSVDGSQVQEVHLNDYNYAYQAAGRVGTLCIFLRGEFGNSLSCDDGTVASFDGERADDGQIAVLFDGRRFQEDCAD